MNTNGPASQTETDKHQNQVSERVGWLIGETKSRLDKIDTLTEELRSKRFSEIIFSISLFIVIELINAAGIGYFFPQKFFVLAPLLSFLIMILILTPTVIRRRSISSNLAQISILRKSLAESNAELDNLSKKEGSFQKRAEDRFVNFIAETRDNQKSLHVTLENLTQEFKDFSYRFRSIAEVQDEVKNRLVTLENLTHEFKDFSYRLRSIAEVQDEVKNRLESLDRMIDRYENDMRNRLSGLEGMVSRVMEGMQVIDNRVGTCLSDLKVFHSIIGLLKEERIYLLERIDSNFRSAENHFRSLEDRQAILSDRLDRFINNYGSRLLSDVNGSKD